VAAGSQRDARGASPLADPFSRMEFAQRVGLRAVYHDAPDLVRDGVGQDTGATPARGDLPSPKSPPVDGRVADSRRVPGLFMPWPASR
jgi:hypothetical protein